MDDSYDSVLTQLKISVRHAFRYYVFENKAEAKLMMYNFYHELARDNETPVAGAAEALRFASSVGKGTIFTLTPMNFPSSCLKNGGC